MATIRLTHKSFETVGDHTLWGLYSNALRADQSPKDDPILVIEIEQTDMMYRRKNGGPALVIMPEFAPMCLIKDVLSLTKSGIKVEIREVEVSAP